ncbi:MAG: hypothetical protein WA733_15610 [Methylocystis sp.]
MDGQLTKDGGHERLHWGDEDPVEHLRSTIARIESLAESLVGVRQSDLRWRGSAISDVNGFADREQVRCITVEELLASSVSPVTASWYTGLLRIPVGKELTYVHGGFHSEYDTDLIVEIEAGAVSRQWIIDNRPGDEGRKREAETVKKSILVFKPVFDFADESEYRAAIGKPLQTIFLSWKEQREDNDRPRMSGPRVVAKFRAEMEDTYRNWAIVDSFPVKSAGLGEAIGYFLWAHFARRASQAELMSHEDREARAAYDKAIAMYDGALCAIASTYWWRKHIASRDAALGKLPLAAFAAVMCDEHQREKGFDDCTEDCEKAQKLLSKSSVPSNDEEMLEWAIDQIRSAERSIADEKFELVGLADCIVYNFAEESDRQQGAAVDKSNIW